MKIKFLLILILTSVLGFSQDSTYFDGLDKQFKSYLFSQPDSALFIANQQQKYASTYKNHNWEAAATNNIGNYFYVTNHLDSAVKYYLQIFHIPGTEDDYLRMGSTYNNLGNVYKSKTDYIKAFEFYSKSMEYYKKLNDESRLFSIYSNIGILLDEKGDYPRALEYYYTALRIAEKSDSDEKKANVFNNIAIVYKLQGDYKKALDYNFKSLELRKKLNLQYHVITSLNNIANIYKMQGNYDEAILFYDDAMKMSIDYLDTNLISMIQNNLGSVFMMKKDYESAFNFYTMSLKNKEYIDDIVGTVEVMRNLGEYFNAKNELSTAIEWCTKSYLKAVEYDLLLQQEDACNCLYVNYKDAGKYAQAVEYLEKYYEIKDSVFNDEKNEAILEQEFNYKLDKKTYEDSLNSVAEQQVLQATIEKEENQIVMLYIGIGVVFIFLGFLYNRFKITRKQKEIIEETNEELNQTNEELAAQRDEIEQQKNRVEVAHQEIRDSITYAKRIQEAILPSMESMNVYLKDGFVLYKPKDVVAGDFYWLEKYKNNIYVAAADCTGHGVPGAMVSVVCSNALTKALMEDGITDVGKILDRTREMVIHRLAKSSDVKDGMDISLACFDFDNMKLEWAGANNPLYLLRTNQHRHAEESMTEASGAIQNTDSSLRPLVQNDDERGIIQITKGDREPIGYTENPTPFTTHKIDLQKGDIVYLFTDGYADQFGGPEGKKIGYKLFRDKLVELSTLEMDQQKDQLQTYFSNWKENEEQVDDVCLIGVKI